MDPDIRRRLGTLVHLHPHGGEKILGLIHRENLKVHSTGGARVNF